MALLFIVFGCMILTVMVLEGFLELWDVCRGR